ncbi:MAG: transglycosylase domain-containing protein, partial [candidate division Zixibacteria bacterium]|nr:transglycosylase domain-containing protein [candidate division Zixibacteria bacterium]NIT52828.1 transglycosylase domain-containing protein [candidate division Zixibacteria bacterium]NIU15598.1 transglycosylase domain-containing protein [candidate division Zixibacteria bacterium]NIV07743.1 penicillin-binding protein [candidate division Zixibacteria bacterium]NIX58896.1 penicillin-binding protein [candidate division Zixibacteria bacterium]
MSTTGKHLSGKADSTRAQKRPQRRRKKKSPRKTKLFRGLKLVVFLFLIPIIIGIGIGGFFAFARGVPSIEDLKQEVAPPSTQIFADDDSLIGDIKIMKGKAIPLERMPRVLLDAVVAVEDSSFWTHSGVDYMAIMRAAIKDILERELAQGGSTITQQLAKMAFLSPEKKFRRKLKEMVLARRIEKNLSKEEILTLYLNRAYFGHGAYGVEMAAQTYFGKSVSELAL